MWQRTAIIFALAMSLCSFAIAEGPSTLSPKVVFPNGGEMFSAGQPVEIQWMHPSASPILTRILLSTNGGESYDRILTEIREVNDGKPVAEMRSWTWKNPDIAGSENRIKITLGYVMPVVAEDESDGTFAIKAAAVIKQPITLLAPSGGESYAIGERIPIKWSTEGIRPEMVEVHLSTDNGMTYQTRLAKLEKPGELAGWLWQNDQYSGDLKLQITAYTNGNQFVATTDKAFVVEAAPPVVAPPRMTVLEPNGGEVFDFGQGISIKWNTPGVKTALAEIRLSKDGGRSYSEIVTKVENPAEAGTYLFENREHVGTALSIQVVAYTADGNRYEDMSDKTFTVMPPVVGPSISVVSPAAGDVYKLGDAIAIKWSNMGMNPEVAEVYLSTDAGKTYTERLTRMKNPGEASGYIWVNNEHMGKDLMVKVVARSQDMPYTATSGLFTVDGTGMPTSPVASLSNFPNPFNPVTTISFDLAEAGTVKLAVYDLLGREVTTLVNGSLEAGHHDMRFDGSNLPSGTYLYRLEAANQTLVNRMLLAK